MPAIATPEVLFLFEDEVREAGRRLAHLRALRASAAEEECADEGAIGQAMVDALNVCMAALAGAERDNACLMMVRKPDLGLTPNVEVSGRPQECQQSRSAVGAPLDRPVGPVAGA